jgi:hypothetical protein
VTLDLYAMLPRLERQRASYHDMATAEREARVLAAVLGPIAIVDAAAAEGRMVGLVLR